MTATKVLIIYSVDQKVRRTVIVLDHEGADDAEFKLHESNMVPGEANIYVPLDIYEGFGDITNPDGVGARALDAYLESQVGAASDPRCAVITGEGDVVAVISADPRIDDHPDGFLIQEPDAVAGDQYDFATQQITPGDAP